MHIALPKWPIKQFIPAQQSRQQALRAYCPNIHFHTVDTVLVSEVWARIFCAHIRKRLRETQWVQIIFEGTFIFFFKFVKLMPDSASVFCILPTKGQLNLRKFLTLAQQISKIGAKFLKV